MVCCFGVICQLDLCLCLTCIWVKSVVQSVDSFDEVMLEFDIMIYVDTYPVLQ
jgi:hypothetical protein